MARDDDFLAALHLYQQLGQPGLGLKESYSGHEQPEKMFG
jgi:hypothetical protein